MRTKQLVGLSAAVAALLSAGIAIALRRRRSKGAAPPEAPAGKPGGDPADAPPVAALATETFACEECGHELRRHGQGRHTVYWEPEASSSDPLLEPVCPSCSSRLPHEHPERAH